jgi:hypothetical protein
MVNYRDDTQGCAVLHLEYSLKPISRVEAADPRPQLCRVGGTAGWAAALQTNLEIWALSAEGAARRNLAVCQPVIVILRP